MGCCASNIELSILNPEQHIMNLVSQANLSDTKFEFISDFDKESINKLLIQYNNIKTNALGLGFLLSNIKLIRYLHQHLNASFPILEAELQCQDAQLIELAIDNFSPEAFKYYIPIYLSSNEGIESMALNETINFTSFCIPNIRKKVHPMRYATEKEKFEFLEFILRYYKNAKPPECFNIHSVDEETGENCALIACRMGKKQCDFRVVNKNGENALNLALLCNSPVKSYCNVAVFPYLIEIVGLDIAENYEESLMICRNPVLTQYIEEKLKTRQVYVTKQYVESKYNHSFSFPNLISDNPSKFSSFFSIPSPIELRESSISFI
jgi:hypothetical protein